MSAGPVMSITDDQIAEIELDFQSARKLGREAYIDMQDGEALIARLREAERDAARYQFLRESGKFSPSAFGGWALNCGYTRTRPSLLDAAIDDAMKGEKK